jgi:hypothetical protein
MNASASSSCQASKLVVWIDTSGNAAAGSFYYTLKFTNQSTRPCTLTGYPGVSAVDLLGHTLGQPATREPLAGGQVRLGVGGTASARLRIIVAENFPPSTCHPSAAAGLRVYPPSSTASKLVPIPFEACSGMTPAFLSIRPVSS